jgi:curli biogenesis system outer membrane secretion channel CsgG
MRSTIAATIAISAAALLSACATQSSAPAPAPAAKPAPAAEKNAPQCWNGDQAKFQDVGTKATISGVAVECKPTSDGKAAQWMGGKH